MALGPLVSKIRVTGTQSDNPAATECVHTAWRRWAKGSFTPWTRQSRGGVKFHHSGQSGKQFKMYELFILGTFI